MSKRAYALAVLLLLPAVIPVQATQSGDYDGDGKSDVFWRNSSTGANTIWKSGNASTQQATVAVANEHWKVVGTGDFNDDGKSDVFWRNDATGTNAIWRSSNAATPQTVAGVPNLSWQVVGTGDFDGDGRSDVFWRNSTTGADAIWKSGNAATPQTTTGVTNQSWRVVGIGDFDGDGKSDVFWRNTSTGANVIWKSGNAATPQTVADVTSQAWHVVQIGDFNGDGKSDVFWRNDNSGANVIWKSGNSATQQATAGVTSQSWQVVGTGDFDGDGASDVFWRNFRTGGNAIWKSGNATTPQAIPRVTNLAWSVVPYEGQAFSVLSIADVSIAEGNSDTRQLVFTIRLSQPSVSPVTYSIQTTEYAGGNPKNASADGDDYIGNSLAGQSIPAGQVSKTFAVTIKGDTAAEANESFAIFVSGVTGATIDPTPSIGTILNDDANTLWIGDVSIFEGDSGTRPMTFTIRLSRPSTSAVSYNIATADIGPPAGLYVATAGIDYMARSLTGQVIPAGSTSKTFTVTIIGDTVSEFLGESFKVNVSNVVGVVVADGLAYGGILDEESPAP